MSTIDRRNRYGLRPGEELPTQSEYETACAAVKAQQPYDWTDDALRTLLIVGFAAGRIDARTQRIGDYVPPTVFTRAYDEVYRRLRCDHHLDHEAAELELETIEFGVWLRKDAAADRRHDRPRDKADTAREELRAAIDRIVAMAGSGRGPEGERRGRLDAAFIDREGLRKLPKLEHLVDGYLYRDTLAQLNGERGTFKTFLALDWAASVTTGRRWHGRHVTPGRALYFAGEGVAKFDDRLTAWEIARGDGQVSDLEVFREIVDFAAPAGKDADWVYVAAVLSLRETKPALIVVDTLARYTSGHDENSAQDMGQLVTNLDVLRRVTGACVLVVHHTARGTTHGRGSTAVEGAMQSVMLMQRDRKAEAGEVDLATTKQKDSEELPPLRLRLRQVEGTGSVVLDVATATIGTPPPPVPMDEPPRIDRNSPQRVRLAEAIRRVWGVGEPEAGFTKDQAWEVLQGFDDLKIDDEDPANLRRRKHDVFSRLVKAGAVKRVKPGSDRFVLTAEGVESLGLPQGDPTGDDLDDDEGDEEV